MKTNKEYLRAKANLADLKERGEEAVGEDALAYLDSVLTDEEIAESNLRVALMGELIKARQEREISQRELEELSKQSENAELQLDAVLKVLAPLGKTLAIVPIE